MDYRVILYHKQATSARTRFLKFANNSVCAFEPIAKLVQMLDGLPGDTMILPSSVLKEVEDRLGFMPGSLEAEGQYRKAVEVPGETIQIILARITTTDPPFDLAKKAGGAFIDLTQARGLPAIELELLRTAYEFILEG